MSETSTPILKPTLQRGFTANRLKMIAIIAMFIDHIAWAFVETQSTLGAVMHFIGRLTMPIMCFFIAEGYYYTRSVPKYALRLGIFAAVSYIPFILFMTGELPNGSNFIMLNVIYTLLLGLLALQSRDKIKSKALRIIVIIALCILSIPGDWSFFGVLFVLVFGINRGNLKKQIRWFSIVGAVVVIFFSIPYIIALILYLNGNIQVLLDIGAVKKIPTIWDFIRSTGMQLGMFLIIPLLKNYNGEKGSGKYGKWIFYIFYPLHLLIIGLIKYTG